MCIRDRVEADLVVYATGPGFVAADAVALMAQGVTWRQAAAAWTTAALADLADDHPVWGFVDEVWSDRPAVDDRPRPVRTLSAQTPLQAQIAGLIDL